MSKNPLYDLLPAVVRTADVENGEPLRGLYDIMQRELDRVHSDIAQLYENWFVETCDPWVVPYIGDLLGAASYDGEIDFSIPSVRGFIGNLIAFRRRKGTASALEDVASAVSGLPAVVREGFDDLVWSQNVNHLRYTLIETEPRDAVASRRTGTVNLRDRVGLELMHGAFDPVCRSVNVTPSGPLRRRANLPTASVYSFRIRAFQPQPTATAADAPSVDGIDCAPARDVSLSGAFRLSAIDVDAPLYARARSAEQLPERTMVEDVPMPIGFVALERDLENVRSGQTSVYYGENGSFRIIEAPNGLPAEVVDASHIFVSDLSQWSSPAFSPPANPRGSAGSAYMIDPRTGRALWLPPAGSFSTAPSFRANRYRGSAGALGGGGYLREPLDVSGALQLSVSKYPLVGSFSSVAAAIAAWDPSVDPYCVITIEDSRTYTEPRTSTVSIPEGGRLLIRAAARKRPLIRLGSGTRPGVVKVKRSDPAPLDRCTESTFAIDGVWVAGSVSIEADAVGRATLRHCTFVPGLSKWTDGFPLYPDSPSVHVAAPNSCLCLEIQDTILGPVYAEDSGAEIRAENSVMDALEVAEHRSIRIGLAVGSFPTLPTPASVVATTESGASFVVELDPAPDSLESAALELQSALRNLDGAPGEILDASVGFNSERLFVVSGSVSGQLAAGALEFTNNGADTTAELIGLAPSGGSNPTESRGLLLQPKSPAEAVIAPASGTIRVRAGQSGLKWVSVPSGSTSFTDLALALQDAIRAAGPTTPLADVRVAAVPGESAVEEGLIVVAGASDSELEISPATCDRGTYFRLGAPTPKLTNRLAVASPTGGVSFSIATSLSRCTLLGGVRVRETPLIENSIVLGPAVVARRQSGCVRYSYIPVGSFTTRRFACQPDLTIRDTSCTGDACARTRGILAASVQPVLASVSWYDPTYAQLVADGPSEIARGGADESEMGAIGAEHNPARERNIRLQFDDFVPFGLRSTLLFAS